MKNNYRRIFYYCFTLWALIYFHSHNSRTQENTATNPFRYFLDELANEITHDIKSNFTSGELKFINAHSEFFFSQNSLADKSENKTKRKQAKYFSEWIAADRGQVDVSFPTLNQVVSVTHFESKKELPLQVFSQFPAIRGGTNILTWARVDSQGKTERLEFSGVFRIKTKEGEYGLARAFRAVELHNDDWKTIKKDFQWIQKLK